MTRFTLIATLASATLLSACGDGTSFQDDDPIAIGSVVLADGVYTITQGDTETTLNEDDSATIGGQRVWITGDRGQAVETDNVLAVAGITEEGTPFGGISGTAADAPAGNATFVGGYGVFSGEDDYDSGDLTLVFNLDDGTLVNDGGDLTVDASVTELGINGTVTFEEQDGNLVGNFFGDDELAGAFTGDAIGGVIFGTQE